MGSACSKNPKPKPKKSVSKIIETPSQDIKKKDSQIADPYIALSRFKQDSKYDLQKSQGLRKEEDIKKAPVEEIEEIGRDPKRILEATNLKEKAVNYEKREVNVLKQQDYGNEEIIQFDDSDKQSTQEFEMDTNKNIINDLDNQKDIPRKTIVEQSSKMKDLRFESIQASPTHSDLGSENVDGQSDFPKIDLLQEFRICVDRGEIVEIKVTEKQERKQPDEGWESRYLELVNLHKLIQTNMNESESIEGREVVMVLGATGAGKSTTINFLLGKKLVWSKIQKQSKSYVYVAEGIGLEKGETEAAKIGTKPMESETRSVNSFHLEIDEKDNVMINGRKNIQRREIILCDTPGLLDSSGSMVEIANQMGIMKSLAQAKSIRVLLLIGYKNLVSVEGKGKLVKEVIDLYSKLIRDFQMSYESVLLGFTHLNGDTTFTQISNQLKAMTDSDGDEKVLRFLDIVIQNLDQNSSLCALVRPLNNQDRNGLIEQIFAIKAIPRERVKEQFTYALAINTKNDFELNLQRFQRDIIALFEREEYPEVRDRLNILQLLSEEIQFPFVQKIYEETLVAVIDVESVRQVISQIQRIPLESFANFPRILENFIKSAKYITWTDTIKNSHKQVRERIISLSELEEILSVSLEMMFNQIEKTDHFKNMEDHFQKLYTIYYSKDVENSLKEGSKRIYLDSYYEKACESVRLRITLILQELNAMLNSHIIDISHLEGLLSKLLDLHEHHIGVHLQINTSDLYHKQTSLWREFTMKKFEIFRDLAFQKDNLKEIKDNLSIISSMDGNQRLVESHMPHISHLLSQMYDQLISYGSRLIDEILRMKKLKEMERRAGYVLNLMEMSEEIGQKLQNQASVLFAHLGSLVQRYDSKFSSCIIQIEILIKQHCSEQVEAEMVPSNNSILQMVQSSVSTNVSGQEFVDISQLKNDSGREIHNFIEKKMKSMKKILDKLSKEFFSSFKFFINFETKCQNSLGTFQINVVNHVRKHIAEFTVLSCLLNGLFTLQLHEKYFEDQEKNGIFLHLIEETNEKLRGQIGLLFRSVHLTEIPSEINEQFEPIEDLVKEIRYLLQFVNGMERLSVMNAGQNYLESILQCESSLVKKLKVLIDPIEQFGHLDAKDYEKVKVDLDQLQKLKSFVNIYSLMNYDIYGTMLGRALSEQKKLIEEVSESLLDNSTDSVSEKTLSQLGLIQAANILYLTHFQGKLENPTHGLLLELQMKQKGLDKHIKQLIKSNSFDDTLEYLNKSGASSEAYKQIKKGIKQRTRTLSHQVQQNIVERTFLDENSLLQMKEDLIILDSASTKLSSVLYKHFDFKEQLSNTQILLDEFVQEQLLKLKKHSSANKIEKSHYHSRVILSLLAQLSPFLRENESVVKEEVKKEMEKCFRSLTDNIDIENKQVTCKTLSTIQSIVKMSPQYEEQFTSMKSKVNSQIQEKAISGDFQSCDDNLLSIETHQNMLKNEFSQILAYSVPDGEKGVENLLKPIADKLSKFKQKVDSLFEQHDIKGINYLIDGDSSLSVLQRKYISTQYQKRCNECIDLVHHKQFIIEQVNFISGLSSQFPSKTIDVQNSIIGQLSKLQSATLEALNKIIIENQSNGLSEMAAYYNFIPLFVHSNELKANTPLQISLTNSFTNLTELFCLESNSILKDIQSKLKDAVNALDHWQICSQVSLIESLQQTRIQLIGTNIQESSGYQNVIDVFKKYIALISDQVSTSNQSLSKSSFSALESTINEGFWTAETIELDLLAVKTKEINENIQIDLDKRNYRQASETKKKMDEFVKQISQSTFIKADSKDSEVIITQSYEKKIQKAYNWRDRKEFNTTLFNMIQDIVEFETYFKDLVISIANTNASEQIVRDIKDYISNKSTEIINQKEIKNDKDIKEFVNRLSHIRQIGFNIGQVHDYTLSQINQVISTKFVEFNAQLISEISSNLREEKLGILIIQENSKNFEGLLNKMIQEVSKDQFNVQYVNNNITGKDFIVAEFTSQYELYETSWKNLLSLWQKATYSVQDILSKTILLFERFSAEYSSNYSEKKSFTWTLAQKQELVVMLAHLSTFWSVINCQRKEEGFRKLHPVQVSTVMRLLSIDTTYHSNPFESHLVQVKTGEGKSIILGITSGFLGLLGFNVDCCCYSSYLSQRDLTSFSYIFQSLEITDRIKYNTFEKQFEDIINDPQDIRKMGLHLIQNTLGKQEKKRETKERKRILLIDEVDFFFGEDFIGRTYPVALYYNNQDVIDILKYVWQNRSIHMDKFKQTSVYKKLFMNNPSLNAYQSFIDERIKMMYEDVNNLEGHTYLTYTPAGKSKTIICYKSLDGISFNTVKGYKTAFAYIQEWEKKNITEEVMNENLSIIINVGCFSFAQIPQQYSLILGVTGTLEDMSSYQKQLTKELFQVNKLTISPSIYGQSKFIFNAMNDVQIFDSRQLYHKEITRQISELMQARRAVIVFFENKLYLDTFKKQFSTTHNWQVLSEETNFKGHSIVKAGSLNMITLATRPFGRGCDFISTDPLLDKHGGVHVIQTFFSQELSEETQIKGRTARQGQRGSFSIVLCKDDLLSAFTQKPKQHKYTYDSLHQLRLQIQKEKVGALQLKLDSTLKQHQESMRLKEILLCYSSLYKEEILSFLLKFNRLADKLENKTNLYNFYSDFAGKIGIFEHGFEYDSHMNPKHISLGNNGQFTDQSLLIGLFYTEEGLQEDIQHLLIPVLRKKGFKACEVVTRESDFASRITSFDQVWVISGYKFHSLGYEKKFQDAIEQHLRSLKGLMIWADNNPYIIHANLILQRISIGMYNKLPIHIKLDGSDYCDKILKAGITICHPQIISNTPKDNFGHLNIIGISSASKPCFFVLSGTENRGRIVFDCGFTKLMRDQWNTAGTVTYVTNCYSWLFWKERLIINV